MKEEKDKVLQFLVAGLIFFGWLILCEDVGAAALVTMVWLLWLIYSK